MARTPSISDEQILTAARETFYAVGYQATTAEIARRAGISEGTIFRRFGTKEQLFYACMKGDAPMWFETLDQLAAQLADRESALTPDAFEAHLTELANQILIFFEDMVPRINTMLHAGVDVKQLFKGMRNAPPIEGIKKMALFLEHAQRRGLVRPGDTEVMARMFMGSLFHQAWYETSGFNAWLPMPRSTYTRGVVHFLLHGLLERADSS
ncbi:MAG: helix-turn-helix domain-containing protein [Myxococcota bacterium]